MYLRGAVKYYFADFVRKGGGVPPKSVAPFLLKKIRKGGEGGTPQIRNSFFANKKIRKRGVCPTYGQYPQSSI